MANRRELIQTAKELNEVLEPQPSLPTGGAIKNEVFISRIQEAAVLLTPDDDLSEFTKAMLQEIAPDIMKTLTEGMAQEEDVTESAVIEDVVESAPETEELVTTEAPEPAEAELTEKEKELAEELNKPDIKPVKEPKPETMKKKKTESAQTAPRTYYIGEALSELPEGSVEALAQRADILYVENGGKSNLKETKALTSMIINAFLGYGIVERHGQNYETVE